MTQLGGWIWLIPLLPLAGSLAAAVLGWKILKEKSHWPVILGVGASAVLSLVVLAITAG